MKPVLTDDQILEGLCALALESLGVDLPRQRQAQARLDRLQAQFEAAELAELAAKIRVARESAPVSYPVTPESKTPAVTARSSRGRASV